MNAKEKGIMAVPNKKKKSSKQNYRQIIISALVILALIAFVLPDILRFTNSGPSYTPSNQQNASNAMNSEPVFTKEGELSFISSETGDVIKQIDIEKAENDMERGYGMMFRRSNAEDQGMLFIFDKAGRQSFWMKNTYIPLDILFVDENRVINTIHANARPLDETSLPSKGPAQFVVEVNGGFCEKYGIKEGDKISWQ